MKLSIRSLLVAAVLSVCIGLLSLAPATDARPQQRRGRNYSQTHKFHKNVVKLKISQTANVSVVNNQFSGEPADQVAQLNSILSSAKRIKAEKLISGTPKNDLESKLQNSLKNYYKVRFAQDVDINAIVSQLEGLDIVETAYGEAKPAPVPTADYSGLQGYLGAAPNGVDSNFASTIPGGTGDKVKIVDIEYNWNTNHEDLSKARNALVPNGTPNYNPYAAQSDNDGIKNHGTAVLGELIADKNGFGVTGAAHGAQLNLVNVYNNERGYDLLNSLAIATFVTKPGDVIVIEQQTWGPTDELYDFVPVEYVPEIYDIIKFATDAGRIVVEAAGNGNQNLDDSAYYGTSFPAGKPDSGAIIVGAGKSCLGDPLLSRMDGTNYGRRVNLQGPGNCVATTGYGNLNYEAGENGYYTQYFNSTSAATPVVAAAAASMSSAYQTVKGTVLTPLQVRDMLVQSGTAQNTSGLGALAGNIGPLPDLAKALNSLVTPPVDTTPPSTPTGLTVRISNRKPVLSWRASTDNVKVASYQIYRNNVLYKTVTGLTFTDTSVSRRTRYSYKVAAVDTSGNVSPFSTTVSVTTPR